MRLTRSAMGWVTATACALSLVAGAVVAGGTAQAAPAPQAAPAAKPKIEHAVLASYAKGETADVWVRLADRADLTAATKIKNRAERGRKVVDDLKAAANRSQAPVLKALAAEGLAGRPYWAANVIHVRNLPEAAARKIARMPGVAELRQARTYQLVKPVSVKASDATPQGLEWGLSNIHADQAWAETGARGEGIVVANIDTGVQYDHPALARQYRGANGDGTFTHDYNWYDPSGICADSVPCDNNQHGTHTMGTMVGDDGQGNQIGVAPGAKWIAAKGCETDSCSDASLLAASQWMLAPTDAAGDNPDPAKRPDIVNNSWGADPGTDPLFEDVQLAWAAAGIMGVWASGNAGKACQTTGPPGSRTINYSVGAYDSANKIATFSSRGSGQDGEIKPNISAPGVNVRSAVPGGGYAALNGTSMATPHVSGAVALLWSSWPEYRRDPATTRSLLDLSAVDTADAQCGGTAENNNVYGEGRLDALALVRTGALGVATLSGTVTDAATGQPVAGATVAATGPKNRTLTTGADGTYTMRLVGGDYQLTTTAFGYQQATVAVTLAKGDPITRNVALTPTQRVNVTGTVTDGSGQGWALAATITADDGNGHAWRATTDPDTGAYTLPLLPGLSYTLTITATVPGYDPATRPLALGESGQRLDVALTVAALCTARGYQPVHDGSTEAFGTGRVPKGWHVTNVDPRIPGYAYKPGWEFTDPGDRGNHTGGAGGFAVVDSLNSGAGHVQNTYLTSPSYDMSDRTHATIEFAHDLQPAINSATSVDLSLDGGATWTTVWTAKGYPGAAGPAAQVIPIPQANGASDVRYRLHYQGQRSGWWAVDDAFAGDRTCEPVTG